MKWPEGRRSACQPSSLEAGGPRLPGHAPARLSGRSRRGCPARPPSRVSSCSSRRGSARSPGPRRCRPRQLFLGAGAVLVGAHDRAVDHRVFFVGVCRQVKEHAPPHARLGPTGEPGMDVLPSPEPLGQVPPRHASTVAIQNRLDEQAVVRRSHTRITLLPREQAAYALPLVVAKPITPHPSAPCLPATCQPNTMPSGRPRMRTRPSTTLPYSQQHMPWRAVSACWAVRGVVHQGTGDMAARFGQRRAWRRSGRCWGAVLVGRVLPFPPRSAGIVGRRGRFGTGARGGAGRARSVPRSGRGRVLP